MYKQGDLVVHPLHGTGRIADIVNQRVDGREKSYYVLSLTAGNVRILVPVDSCEAIGVRPVVPREEAQALLDAFPSLEVSADASWNRRYRENMVRLKSGKLEEVFAVVKGLLLRERSAGLSAGERKMLSTARQILYSELTVALDTDVSSLDAAIESMLGETRAENA